MKSFFFRPNSNYDKEYGKKDWLYINNFGYYTNVPKDIVSSCQNSRADYHLLYVLNGEIRANGKTLKNGDAYLFLPNEPYLYTYKSVENNHYFWIHFTGNKVAETLDYCEISKGYNKSNDKDQDKCAVLSMILSELCKCTNEASDFSVSLFFSFLSLFKSNPTQNRLYVKAVEALENTTKDVSINSIAESYNITAAHFIRSFKASYGMTPNEYRLNFRISQAINLLSMTNLSINEIAAQCGFVDSFYFSRIFKKKVGVSPSKYRK